MPSGSRQIGARVAGVAIALLALALSFAACDRFWHLDLSVQVPPETLAAASRYPQELRVRWGYRGAGFWFVDRLGVLCSGSAVPFSARVTLEGMLGKCPGPIDLVAWLEPLDPAMGLACGPRGAAEELGHCESTAWPCGPGNGAPSGQGTAFASGCRDSDALSLTVAPLAAGTSP
jgi:hypothetical protein